MDTRERILNGAMDRDWEGEFTYVGARDNTVIDYVIVNEKMIELLNLR